MPREQEHSSIPLQVSELNKRFGPHHVLRDLALEVLPGAIHGLVGLNGSGKTTTLECLLGLRRADTGDIRLHGLRPDQLHQSHGDVVAIFDSPSLPPQLTVRQALEQASLLCENPVRKPQDVESLLGISQYRNFRIRTLSLGNRRRTSIAHALLGSPRLVLLDEPFNGLDAGGVEDVLTLIRDLNRDEGTAFLLSSHQLPYLEKICSHFSILHEGRIALSDSLEQLLGQQINRLQVVCDDVVRACAIVQDMPGVVIEENSGNGQLTLQLNGVTPAAVNQRLVSKGIAVDELIRERSSLASLFQAITARPADTSGEAA